MAISFYRYVSIYIHIFKDVYACMFVCGPQRPLSPPPPSPVAASFGNGRLEEWTHMRALLPSELFQRAPGTAASSSIVHTVEARLLFKVIDPTRGVGGLPSPPVLVTASKLQKKSDWSKK